MSLIDVIGKPSFVIWLCGCNLNCPFCHNWKIANSDPEFCSDVHVSKLIEEIKYARYLVDYVQVTGGEPLLQVEELKKLFAEVKDMGLKTSLNSNLTLSRFLSSIVDLVDHVATDIKIPQYMYGVDDWDKMFEEFLKSLRILLEKGKEIELRVLVTKIPIPYYIKVLESVGRVLKNYEKFYIVFRRVRGRPVVVPRSDVWCELFCVDGEEDYKEQTQRLKMLVSQYFGEKVLKLG